MQSALLMLVAHLAADPSTTYAWPLNLPRVLTSSFAEYRSGRYHMGLDLRTGPIGKDVFAASDGYVSRIRCSPHGYGKAIYLQLADGNSVVYAHLDDYAPELREYVRRAQHDRKKYTVDLYPDANELPVTRGQFIGKSGQTGIGVPHLHYEIRDRTGAPINPRLLGITWPDTNAPAFRGVAVVPLDPKAMINGDMLPAVLDVRKLSDTDYIAGPVRVSGAVAFGVDVVDPANGGGTRLGVRTVRTTAGEKEIFLMQHDRVSYDHDQDGIVAYHPYLLEQGRFLMQWRWPGNESELFAYGPGDGRYEPSSDSHPVAIVVEDFNGNRATLTVPIVFVPEISVTDPPGANRSGGTVEYDHFPEWLVVTARFARAERDTPTLRALGERNTEASFRRIDEKTFRAAYVPGPGETEVRLSALHPRLMAHEETFIVVQRGMGPAAHVRGDIRITSGPESAYGTMFIRVETVEAEPGKALHALGPAYRIGHPSTPVDQAMRLSFPLPPGASDAARVHIYKKGRKRWEFHSTTRSDGRLSIDATRLGIYAALEDSEAPVIKNVRPKDGQKITSPRPRIRATISDLGSNIDTFSGDYNGRWLLMEYDPELQSLTWEQDEDLPSGPGVVEFRVSDQAGNVTVRRVGFEITAG